MGNPLRFWRRSDRGMGEAVEALEQAKAERAAVQAQWPEVRDVAGALRQQRIDNRFAARFAEAYKARRA